MEIHDARFACERRLAGRWRVYDSIECLLRDTGESPGGAAWLADYDGRSLHAADSMWIAQGEFPSPMGGGYAAFLDSAAAGDVAGASSGSVARLAELLAAAREEAP